MPIDTSAGDQEQKEYDQTPDGNHVAVGIDFIKTYLDDQELPFYKEKDGETYIVVKVKLKSGGEGPGWRINKEDLPLAVRAFKGDATSLTANDEIGNILKMQEIINGSGEEIKIVTKNGYVTRVNGFCPDSGYYQYKFSRVVSRTTEGISYFERKSQQWDDENSELRTFIAELEVVGTLAGNPSPFSGCKVQMWIPYA
ncbi:MAG TPA: hypothetical protein ENH85_12420, partial [Candidatus Scalindua sp.]|nr:hypothetical protein [Candidatus Scalindua sp.]